MKGQKRQTGICAKELLPAPPLHIEAIAVDTDPKLLPLNAQITVCFGEPGNV